ncbi:hypothetical protein DVH24_039386 [Malus domestica]|uniref:Uncharacterized protein n=1 Tax=Malus domestica TaxID=3750 RepID=A0A498I1D8_MALDO|nr:hypothetical protein DVH24_039386 [Malus domestica]
MKFGYFFIPPSPLERLVPPSLVEHKIIIFLDNNTLNFHYHPRSFSRILPLSGSFLLHHKPSCIFLDLNAPSTTDPRSGEFVVIPLHLRPIFFLCHCIFP